MFYYRQREKWVVISNGIGQQVKFGALKNKWLVLIDVKDYF